MDSPRGRLLLMKAAAEGRIPVSDKFALHMERCLVCRACETVCPSGVQFGRAMESARAVLQRTRAERRMRRLRRGPGAASSKISSQQADDESQPASSLGVGRPDLSEVRSPGACPKVGGPREAAHAGDTAGCARSPPARGPPRPEAHSARYARGGREAGPRHPVHRVRDGRFVPEGSSGHDPVPDGERL